MRQPRTQRGKIFSTSVRKKAKRLAERFGCAGSAGQTSTMYWFCHFVRFSETTLPADLRPQARALILYVRQSPHGRLLRWKFYDENLTVLHDWNSTSVALQYFEVPGGEDYDGSSGTDFWADERMAID
ncbi:uncharacterized protein LOC144097585 isoform X2 [Amblyomma americanum]